MLTDQGVADRLRNMNNSYTLVYLDVEEYERVRGTAVAPEIYCTAVEGYWVIIVPEIVYELEYRGLLTDEERLSIYIERKLN